MTKQQWIENKYKQVDHLPSEWAVKHLIALLLEEVWQLKQKTEGKE